MKRFYHATGIERRSDHWQVVLDGRPVKTPGKRTLALPTQALAQALAAEWAAQGETVQPETMPLTQYACSALDRVAPARGQVIGHAAAYAETDLLAYPAPEPPELRARQDALWLPVLEHLERLGWTVRQSSGLVPLDQAPETRARAAAWLEGQETLTLTALASLVQTSGSFFLTYLHAQGALKIDEVIEACSLEERFGLETWGRDAEAEQLLARRDGDLRSAAQMLNLLQ